MSNTVFQKTLSWAEDRGLHLDERIERKQVNGLYGMYAKNDMPAGSILASIPTKVAIPYKEYGKQDDGLSDFERSVYAAATEIQKGEASDYYGCFSMFEELEDCKNYNIYYFDQKDLSLLEKINPVGFVPIMDTYRKIKQTVSKVLAVDPSLDKSAAIKAAVNRASRSWDFGFLPVMDLFNHSDRKGATLKAIDNKTKFALYAATDYKKGDQIFISYGRKDIAEVATNFNYFDPDGPHYVDYAVRAVQSVKSNFREKLSYMLAKKYNGNVFESNGAKYLSLLDRGLFFTENAPSMRLCEFFRDSSYESEEQLVNGQVAQRAVLCNLMKTIDSFLQANHVDEYECDKLPKKLHRFYDMFKKEKHMLQANREWVLDNIDL